MTISRRGLIAQNSSDGEAKVDLASPPESQTNNLFYAAMVLAALREEGVRAYIHNHNAVAQAVNIVCDRHQADPELPPRRIFLAEGFGCLHGAPGIRLHCFHDGEDLTVELTMWQLCGWQSGSQQLVMLPAVAAAIPSPEVAQNRAQA